MSFDQLWSQHWFRMLLPVAAILAIFGAIRCYKKKSAGSGVPITQVPLSRPLRPVSQRPVGRRAASSSRAQPPRKVHQTTAQRQPVQDKPTQVRQLAQAKSMSRQNSPDCNVIEVYEPRPRRSSRGQTNNTGCPLVWQYVSKKASDKYVDFCDQQGSNLTPAEVSPHARHGCHRFNSHAGGFSDFVEPSPPERSVRIPGIVVYHAESPVGHDVPANCVSKRPQPPLSKSDRAKPPVKLRWRKVKYWQERYRDLEPIQGDPDIYLLWLADGETFDPTQLGPGSHWNRKWN